MKYDQKGGIDMELEEALLDSQSRTKLAILSYLMERPRIKIYYPDIKKQYNISRVKFNVLSAELSSEIEELFGFSLMRFPHSLYLDVESVCFNVYLRYLIRKGLSYQFVLYSLIFPEEKIDFFLKAHFVSRSTVTRALKPFKEHAEKYDLKVNYSKVSLSGEEGKLRFFYMKVLWLGSLGRDLEESDIDFSDEKRLADQLSKTNFSNVSKELMFLHLSISKIRTVQGRYLSKIVGCENLYPEHSVMLDTHYKKITNDPIQVISLINSFKYQFVFAFYYSSEKDTRLSALVQFYEELKYTEPVFVQFFERFLTHTKQYLLDNFTEPLNKDIANLFSIMYLNYLTKGNALMFLGFDLEGIRQNKQYNTTYFQLIKRDIHNFLKTYIRRNSFDWLTKNLSDLSRSLTLLVYPYYRKREDKKVIVIITPVLNYLAMQHIILFLDQLSFIEYSTNTKDIECADVILSNFNENVPTIDVPVFIFQMNNQEKNLIDLFQLLWEIYQKKNGM